MQLARDGAGHAGAGEALPNSNAPMSFTLDARKTALIDIDSP